MRLSVYENGPCPGVRVLLDGIERNRVVEADEEARFIVRHKTDERGLLVLNAKRDEVEKERLDGHVVILVPSGFVPRKRMPAP